MDISQEAVNFITRRFSSPKDHERLQILLAEGLNPNTVINGQHIFIHMYNNNRAAAHDLIPFLDFELRFGGNGTNLSGWLVHKIVHQRGRRTEPLLELYSTFIAAGADPHSWSHSQLKNFKRSGFDQLFSYMLYHAQFFDNSNNKVSILKDFFTTILDRGIYPSDCFFDKTNIDPSDPYTPNIPLRLRSYWSAMVAVRQRDRLNAELNNCIDCSPGRTRKL